MTETSTVYADQVCQANQDCYFSIVGQICLDNKCTFYCQEDTDCVSNGKCIGEKCDWSGEPVPPLLLPSNSTQMNLDATNPSEKTTDDKFSLPILIAIVIVVALVVIFCTALVLFLVMRRRKLVESSRGLIPLQLSGSGSRSSLKKSKRDSRERERSSKKFHDDDLIGQDDENEGKEDFENSFSPAAVGMGTHRPPQRSHTMYGTSSPSTVEVLNVGDYPIAGQHHFMQQQQYLEMERDDKQQQQQKEEEELG